MAESSERYHLPPSIILPFLDALFMCGEESPGHGCMIPDADGLAHKYCCKRWSLYDHNYGVGDTITIVSEYDSGGSYSTTAEEFPRALVVNPTPEAMAEWHKTKKAERDKKRRERDAEWAKFKREHPDDLLVKLSTYDGPQTPSW